MKKTFYEILGVQIGSTYEDIKKSYRNLCKQYHPDSGNTAGEHQKFVEVQLAYGKLSDPISRKQYDEQLYYEMDVEKKSAARNKLKYLDDKTKIEIILAWSINKKTFRTSFTCNCANLLAAGENLSPKMKDGLDNIICNFGINIDHWLDEDIRKTALEEFFEKYEEQNEGKYSDF